MCIFIYLYIYMYICLFIYRNILGEPRVDLESCVFGITHLYVTFFIMRMGFDWFRSDFGHVQHFSRLHTHTLTHICTHPHTYLYTPTHIYKAH